MDTTQATAATTTTDPRPALPDRGDPMTEITYDRESATRGADAWLDGQVAEALARFNAAGRTVEARIVYRDERREAARAHDRMIDGIDEQYPQAVRDAV